MGADDIANRKFEKAKLLFDQGLIKEFKELFDVVSYTAVAKKLNINNVRFKAKMDDPTTLKVSEVTDIANLLNIDAQALFSLVRKDPTLPSIPEAENDAFLNTQ